MQSLPIDAVMRSITEQLPQANVTLKQTTPEQRAEWLAISKEMQSERPKASGSRMDWFGYQSTR